MRVISTSGGLATVLDLGSGEPVGTFQGSCVTFSMFPMNIKSPGAPGRNLFVRAMSRDNIWPDSTTSLWDDCWGDHNKPEQNKPEQNKPEYNKLEHNKPEHNKL